MVELLVIMSIIAILSGLATINLIHSQRGATLQSTLLTFIADTKQQQMKAMQGDTEGRSYPDYYGIHFTQNSYVLFHGTTYNSSDSANFTISLDSNLQFNPINLTNNNIIFIPLNGEVYGYSSAANSVSLLDITNKQNKTLKFNYLGVMAGIN